MVGRDGLDPFTDGDREAWQFQSMDRVIGDCRFFFVLARHIFGPLWRADFGACICIRPQTRCVYIGIFGGGSGNFTHLVCMACPSRHIGWSYGVGLS